MYPGTYTSADQKISSTVKTSFPIAIAMAASLSFVPTLESNFYHSLRSSYLPTSTGNYNFIPQRTCEPAMRHFNNQLSFNSFSSTESTIVSSFKVMIDLSFLPADENFSHEIDQWAAKQTLKRMKNTSVVVKACLSPKKNHG
jgi:hypothetical protein